MASLNSTFERLKRDFPTITFAPGDTFAWSADRQTISYPSLRSRADLASLLHELGHATAVHHDYSQDIELIKLERSAWDVACTIAATYDIAIDDRVIEDHLDSYRDWLYARSRCPGCSQPGIQRRDGTYGCVLCGFRWQPNEAKKCQLRRLSLPKTRP